ncbi:MAG: nucleotide exchange factor GrpE [Acidimicrobiales bacterium]
MTADAQDDQAPLADDTARSDSSESDASNAVSADAGDRQDPSEDGQEQELTVEVLVTTLEVTTAERDDYLDRWQRTSAEFANFKKQTEKRNNDVAAQAGSRVAEALLPVLDACEAAELQGVDGVEPIAAQLRAELERAGLQVIADVDAPFDPNLHEAAMSEPGDDAADGPVVAQVLRTGYAWNGRVLRAAMVKVRG